MKPEKNLMLLFSINPLTNIYCQYLSNCGKIKGRDVLFMEGPIRTVGFWDAL